MLSLISKPLSTHALAHLNSVQRQINGHLSFIDKVTEAANCWGSRTNNVAFTAIKVTLTSMCVGTEICNYCENNEATDIEHIYPKSFFPEKAFDWENYLLACKTCNSHYKLDKIAVFNPVGSNVRQDVVRGSQPPNNDAVFINPRTENPLDYFQLSLHTGVFLEKQPIGTREYGKAEYTLQVLALNNRDALREAREARAKDYFRKLQYAVKVAEATTFTELDDVINDNEPFIDLDRTRLLTDVQSGLLASIKTAIATAPHPTVWVEMKQQHLSHPRIAALFARLPEALTW